MRIDQRLCALIMGLGVGLSALPSCSRGAKDEPVAKGLYSVELPVEDPKFGVVEVLDDQGEVLLLKVDGRLFLDRQTGWKSEDVDPVPRTKMEDWGSEHELYDQSIFRSIKPQPM